MHLGRRRHGRSKNMADTTSRVRASLPLSPPCASLPPPPPPPPRPPPTDTYNVVPSDARGKSYINTTTKEALTEVPVSHEVRAVLGRPINRDSDDPPFGISATNHRRAVTVRSRSAVIASKDNTLQSCGGILSSRSAAARSCTDVIQLTERRGVVEANDTHATSCLGGERHKSQDQQESSVFSVRVTSHSPSRPPVLTQSETTSMIKHPRPWRGLVDLCDCSSSGVSADLTIISENTRWSHPRKNCGCPEEDKFKEKRNERKVLQYDRMSTAPHDEASTSSSSSFCQGSCVSGILLRAEEWLTKNDPENDNCRAASSMAGRTKTGSFSFKGCTPVTSHVASALKGRQNGNTVGSVSVASNTMQREVEEMTGRPKITRLGRSKRRSVDDLLSYQRTVEASRRRKQDERQAMEDSQWTGRPETCTRSKLLVKRMRNGNGHDAYVSVSERLHNEAFMQRQRREDRRARLEAAARLRANPELMASSEAQTPDRDDVGQRLYDQALLGRENAREREYLAHLAPRGATFHPEITPRSVSLAGRRRRATRGKALQEGGGDRITRRRTLLVEEALLAEGIIYNRRRWQRQQRQGEIDRILHRKAKLNRHSKYLLRKVQKRAFTNEAEASLDQGRRSREPKATADNHDLEQGTFTPTLEALGVSNNLLESRYGQGTVPSMEERAKERETKRLEWRKRSGEREKYIPGSGRGRMSRRRTDSNRENNPCRSAGADTIYERTTEYAKQRDRRQTTEREARLVEEMADCTFMPYFSVRRGSRNLARFRRPLSTSPARTHVVGENSRNGVSLPPSFPSRPPRAPRDPGQRSR